MDLIQAVNIQIYDLYKINKIFVIISWYIFGIERTLVCGGEWL